MKIRSGFVSNSSSSSFVLVVPVADHVEAINQLDEATQELMKRVMHGIKPKQVGNEEVLVIDGSTTEDWCRIGDFNISDEWEDLFPGEDWYDGGEAFFDEYRKLLPEDRIVEHSEYR